MISDDAKPKKRMWIVEQTVHSTTTFLIEADSWEAARQKGITEQVYDDDAVGNETTRAGPYRLIREDKTS